MEERWSELKDKLRLPEEVAEALTIDDDIVERETNQHVKEDVDFKLQMVRNQVSNMVALRAALRPLKPTETRANVCKAAKDTIGCLSGHVEPKLGLLLG